MGHVLAKLHDGGHLYNPGGVGEHEFDPAALLSSEEIVETRDLPGFVDREQRTHVTYESHHFWVHFLKYKRRDDNVPEGIRRAQEEERKRFSGVLIRVHHGGGWEVWRGDYMLAKALQAFGDDNRGLFLLCWYLIDTTRYATEAGRVDGRNEYKQAFVDGRLKKRKMPKQNRVKVWIEPPKAKTGT